MWFRNLCVYRLTQAFEYTAEQLEELLQQKHFRPLSKAQPSTLGWHSPMGRESSQLVHASGGFMMICLQKEEKIMPPAAVRELLDARLDEIEDRDGRRPRGKARNALKDEVIMDMLPRAFHRTHRLYAYIDSKNGWLVVDSASFNKAEELAGFLRESLGSLPVRPLESNISPVDTMTRWLESADAPDDLVLGDACELRDLIEDGGVVRVNKQALDSDEVRIHLSAGKMATRLALTFDQRIEFVLDESLLIKRLKFLDIVQEEAGDRDAESFAEQFDVDFAIMTLEIARMLTGLTDALGGELSENRQVAAA